jgi:hypothetical protein
MRSLPVVTRGAPSARATLRPLLLAAAAAATAAMAATVAAPSAGAQDTRAEVRPYRFTVEPFLSQTWFDAGGRDGREGLGGFGVRVMFNRSDAAETVRSLLGRSTVGAFANFTTGQKGLGSTQHIGAELDVSLFPEARARGTLDPFVSLGAGVLRASGGGESESEFAVTPGVGTRISLLNGLGLRGDLRAPVVLGSDTRVNFTAEGGFFVSF